MRLTLKNKEWACQLTTPMYDKLHDLEDIEDELGIELVTLFKALKNGYWNKGGYYSDTILNKKELHFTESSHAHISFTLYEERKNEDDYYDSYICEDNCLCLHEMEYEDPQYIVRVKDYGRTWALTKEELK